MSIVFCVKKDICEQELSCGHKEPHVGASCTVTRCMYYKINGEIECDSGAICVEITSLMNKELFVI